MGRLLVRLANGRKSVIPLTQSAPVSIGTSDACDIVLDDTGLSALHCKVAWENHRYVVRTQPGASGVFAHGELLQMAPLKPGDSFFLGRF